MKISEFEKKLSTRTRNNIWQHFSREGIKISVLNINKMTNKELLDIDGMGVRGVAEVRNTIRGRNMETSEVYDKLRSWHGELKTIIYDEKMLNKMESNKQNALEALHSVLYLVEKEFTDF